MIWNVVIKALHRTILIGLDSTLTEKAMLFLKSFTIPNLDDENVPSRTYPYNIARKLNFGRIEFSNITIFYGDNGCGKSTMLNIIADHCEIKHKSDGNTNSYYNDFVDSCSHTTARRIPEDSAFIRSEDILSKISKDRENYSFARKCANNTLKWKTLDDDEYIQELNDLLRNAYNHPTKLTDDDRFKVSMMDEYRRNHVPDPDFQSNGERALRCYKESLYDNTLYFLDEPEVSLSPVHQVELALYIAALAYRMDSQFVIATHSPFFLSIADAKIFDLDSIPVRTCKWYELENMKEYYNLFARYRQHFEK